MDREFIMSSKLSGADEALRVGILGLVHLWGEVPWDGPLVVEVAEDGEHPSYWVVGISLHRDEPLIRCDYDARLGVWSTR